MNLELKNSGQALNKAYLAQNPYVNEINLFKNHYSNLLKSIKSTDSEETLKDYINDFLKNTYYKEKFFTKENVNNIDLVILNGNSVDDTIGVIIETKALKNVSEMISETDLNKKAFQELIQYYLEERITNSNIEIKHLIITNSIEWFIFNASEFERIFYQNNQLRKNFTDWHTKQLPSKNKDWFYSNIAKSFIENSDETIICTHFSLPNLADFEYLSDLKLVELYKIFSPEHLLKLPFQNDSNTLNQDFYNELLHIIGLCETKDNAKTIERLPENDRNEGSWIENVISIIENDAILDNLENAEQFGETKEEQIFSIALELCITWVNRIIFLKLLESQLLNYNDNEPEYKFLNSEKIKDFELLKELFFEVLALNTNERKDYLNEKYKNIPYLNSSLFEMTQLEKTAVKINHLKHHSELAIFGQTVLKDENEKCKTGSLPVLKYLLDFLDSYNFANDKKVEIQEKNKTLINSSVLGLIFEKLNGYKEGSFYTPGYITMYICRETIRNTVIQKFNSTYNWNCITINHLYNHINNIDLSQANTVFNSIRICDPAVGSGHFLVSALNELIAIKSELGILIDTNGQTLRNTYCEVENDELYTTHFNELFVYNFKDKESQRIQEVIFNEKRTLIENCLFGVDINPKSVQICRLRLWIELLKNAYYIPAGKGQTRSLQTLPNIDINIKSGNSLVSHFLLNGKGKSRMLPQKMQLAANKYKKAVSDYKNASIKFQKQQAEKQIRELKSEISRYVNPTDKDYIEIGKISTEIDTHPIFFSKDEKTQWDLKIIRLTKELAEAQKRYNEKKRTIYGNAFEWRFEFPEVLDNDGNFIGFDAIIGNPPYFSLAGSKQNTYYSENYKTFAKGTDIYCLFIEKVLELLKENGSISFIVSNKWLTAKYGENTRNYLVQNSQNLSVLNFNKYKIFEKATVDTTIISATKNLKGQKSIRIANYQDLKLNKIENLYKHKIEFQYFEPKISELWNTLGLMFQPIKEKIETNSVKLSELKNIQFFRGITTGYNEAFIIDKITKNVLIQENPKCAEIIKPLIRGRDIQKYSIQFQDLWIINTHNGSKKEKINRIILGKKYDNILQYLKKYKQHLDVRQDVGDEWYNLRNCTYLTMFETPKIVFTKASKQQAFSLDTNNYYLLNTSYFIAGENLKFLLGILNSKLINFAFKKFYQSGGIDGEISLQAVENFPIKFSTQIQNEIEFLVNKIIEMKNENTNTEKLENQIDKLVYKLYNLTKEEIKIIENE